MNSAGGTLLEGDQAVRDMSSLRIEHMQRVAIDDHNGVAVSDDCRRPLKLPWSFSHSAEAQHQGTDRIDSVCHARTTIKNEPVVFMEGGIGSRQHSRQ